MTSTGELVKSHREAKSWSRKELARRAGIGISNLAKMESRPNRQPKPETLQKLAKALGVEPGDLIPAESFGERIRQMRVARGWTSSELAKKMRVTERAINYRESRNTAPEYIMILAYAYIFGVEAESIYEPPT